MLPRQTAQKAQFWASEFIYEHRKGGSILMRQAHPLTGYMPVLADYHGKWAYEAPERTWIARCTVQGDWTRISYREALSQARAMGAALLTMGFGA